MLLVAQKLGRKMPNLVLRIQIGLSDKIGKAREAGAKGHPRAEIYLEHLGYDGAMVA